MSYCLSMRSFQHSATTETAVPKQTVPRSGSWLHTFKVSKSAEEMAAPELPNGFHELPSQAEVKQELLSAVSSVLFPAAKVSARKTFGSPPLLGL